MSGRRHGEAGEGGGEQPRLASAAGKRLLAALRDGDWAHPGEEEAVRLLLGGLAPDPRRRVLDAGCGAGGTAAWLQEHGYGRVTGLELDPATAALARERHPEVVVAVGDVQEAARVLAGPFDLLYTMTVLHAVPDQRAALAQLAAVATPGAALRLFEYSDPAGRFAAAAAARGRFADWRPLDPRRLPGLLAATGWRLDGLRDLAADFARWYDDLLARLAARGEALSAAFGRALVGLAAAEYAAIRDLLREGALGGLLACAHREA